MVSSIVVDSSKPYLVTWCRVYLVTRADFSPRSQEGYHEIRGNLKFATNRIAISSVSQIIIDLLRVPLYSSGILEGPKSVGIRWVPGPSAENNRTTAQKGN